MAIFWRTVWEAGSTRRSVPLASEMIQREYSLAVMPPSLSAGPTGSVAVILLVAGSTRANVAGWPQSGTQRELNANARPEQGSDGNSILATRVLVRGSMRWTDFSLSLVTQTAFSEMASHSGSPPRLRVAMGFKLVSGDWTAFMPGFSGGVAVGWFWATAWVAATIANARVSARFFAGDIFLIRGWVDWEVAWVLWEIIRNYVGGQVVWGGLACVLVRDCLLGRGKNAGRDASASKLRSRARWVALKRAPT